MADWLSSVICWVEFIILNLLITCFEWCTVFIFCILFRYELIEAVQLIASELSADSDVDLLVMCATFFNDKSHFEKAVRLLAIARKVSHCIIFFYLTEIQCCYKKRKVVKVGIWPGRTLTLTATSVSLYRWCCMVERFL